MKLKRFPNGLQPSGQTSWGHGLRFCIFALIGLQARRLWGKPDSSVNRRVGHRTQPVEAGRPQGTASQPLHYLLSWGITMAWDSVCQPAQTPPMWQGTFAWPHMCTGVFTHSFAHSVPSAYGPAIFSPKLKQKQEKKKSQKLLLTLLPLWL